MRSNVGVQLMAERVRLRIDGTAVELTLGEAMRVCQHLVAAVTELAEDRSGVPTLGHLLAGLPQRRSA